jgi:outer membrane receptor protein involved in Fe transport
MLQMIVRSAALVLLCLPAAAGAQSDTARAARLEAVVVTADRLATRITSASSAVSRIDGSMLRNNPVRTVADALRLTPGVAFIDFDGMGHDPQIMLRGFYGGGEAEYILLLLDGRPLNALETGRATWDQIPLSAIESVEIVRGGVSAAWGDAALAGVINLRTKQDVTGGFHGVVEGGSFGEVSASASTSASFGGRPLSAFGSYTTSDGFRDHAARSTGGLGARLGLIDADRRKLSFSTSHDWRSVDDPGPLSDVALADSRSASSPFFRFDNNSERTHRGGMDYYTGVSDAAELTAQVGAEFRNADRVRTLVLSPEFGDTKNRVLDTRRLFGSAQLELDGPVATASDDLMFGIDFSLGGLRSSYFNFMQGGEADYADAAATRGDLDASGDGDRATAAGFFVYGLNVSDALRISAGGRLDWLQDAFDVLEPGEAADYAATHVAFSPRFGMNLRYAGGSTHTGHLYANVGRSFKAPTQDQLFDQRSVPVPFPPFSITFANRELNPQFGTSYEAGAWHSAVIAAEMSADLSLSLYQIDLRDELDFDLQTYQYQNIGRSRHRGVETGLTLFGPGALRLFGNYTLQSVKSRSGDNAGKYLKAIPRHFVTAGVGLGDADAATLGATFTSASGMYLDDGNESELESWSRWDVRASYSIVGVRIFVDVLNVLDSKYSSSGFPDPAGSDLVYYYPAAGRSLRLGVSLR